MERFSGISGPRDALPIESGSAPHGPSPAAGVDRSLRKASRTPLMRFARGSPQLRQLLLDQRPGALNVPLFGPKVVDRHAER